MVQLDPNGIEVRWLRGLKRGKVERVTQADADKLLAGGWAQRTSQPAVEAEDKAMDAPPKTTAVKRRRSRRK